MLTKGKVISVGGELAEVNCRRSSMCDGCHRSSCGESCAARGIMGGGGEVTVTALNAASAAVGDTVELESRDGIILLYALAVFIMPLVLGGVLYALGAYALHLGNYALLPALAGFCLAYVAVGALERRRRHGRPDVTVVRVIGHGEDAQEAVEK